MNVEKELKLDICDGNNNVDVYIDSSTTVCEAENYNGIYKDFDAATKQYCEEIKKILSCVDISKDDSIKVKYYMHVRKSLELYLSNIEKDF